MLFERRTCGPMTPLAESTWRKFGCGFLVT